jgi:hypothetical protein
VATVLVALTVLAAVVALGRESPAGPPPPPAPLAPTQAENRLQRQLGLAADGDQGVVRCPGNVGTTRLARCGVIYPDGDTQLLPVRLTPEGDLDVEVPYPAQRRPGP